jgi:Raf kinase inhibitor-like YbhB/YbcL family protein
MIIVKSNAYPQNETINTMYAYDQSGCKGQNISPDIEWSETPTETKSIAVTIFDYDARDGKGWSHWVVFNIPRDVLSLQEGASGTDKMPDGATESLTDYGKPGYGGPCPPVGDTPHHYKMTVYALKDKITFDKFEKPNTVNSKIEALKIDEGSIIAFYGR